MADEALVMRSWLVVGVAAVSALALLLVALVRPAPNREAVLPEARVPSAVGPGARAEPVAVAKGPAAASVCEPAVIRTRQQAALRLLDAAGAPMAGVVWWFGGDPRQDLAAAAVRGATGRTDGRGRVDVATDAGGGWLWFQLAPSCELIVAEYVWRAAGDLRAPPMRDVTVTVDAMPLEAAPWHIRVRPAFRAPDGRDRHTDVRVEPLASVDGFWWRRHGDERSGRGGGDGPAQATFRLPHGAYCAFHVDVAGHIVAPRLQLLSVAGDVRVAVVGERELVDVRVLAAVGGEVAGVAGHYALRASGGGALLGGELVDGRARIEPRSIVGDGELVLRVLLDDGELFEQRFIRERGRRREFDLLRGRGRPPLLRLPLPPELAGCGDAVVFELSEAALRCLGPSRLCRSFGRSACGVWRHRGVLVAQVVGGLERTPPLSLLFGVADGRVLLLRGDRVEVQPSASRVPVELSALLRRHTRGAAVRRGSLRFEIAMSAYGGGDAWLPVRCWSLQQDDDGRWWMQDPAFGARPTPMPEHLALQAPRDADARLLLFLEDASAPVRVPLVVDSRR